MSQPRLSPRPSSWRSTLARFPWLRLALVAGSAFALPLVAVGCSSGEVTCDGVEIQGRCYAACTDSACADGNRCVADLATGVPACRPPCATESDCEIGTNCVGILFPEGTEQHCLPLREGRTGQHEPCEAPADCDEARGFECTPTTLGNQCLKRCTDLKECRSGERCVDENAGGHCQAAPCGGATCDYQGGFECVENACVKQCTAAATECATGELCATHESLPQGGYCKAGPCSSNRDCELTPGYRCIENSCVQALCTEHSQCEGGLCSPGAVDADGGTVNRCTAAPSGEKRGPGQYGSSCPNGLSECADGFVCRSQGEGDLDSYCTELDCQADNDCGTGFHCARIRIGGTPCTDSCPGIEGESGLGCIADANIGAGRQYECGVVNLMRNACVRNSYCHECETHEDCLGKPGQVCAKGPDGGKVCTVACDQGTDSCPWGTASECKVFDTDLGYATCGHRFGACKGTGQGCEPCANDGDCGPHAFCNSSTFTGERYCLDLSVECSCEGLPDSNVPGTCAGGGCPTTPDGLQMLCVRGEGSIVSNRCLAANINTNPLSSPQLGCWKR